MFRFHGSSTVVKFTPFPNLHKGACRPCLLYKYICYYVLQIYLFVQTISLFNRLWAQAHNRNGNADKESNKINKIIKKFWFGRQEAPEKNKRRRCRVPST